MNRRGDRPRTCSTWNARVGRVNSPRSPCPRRGASRRGLDQSACAASAARSRSTGPWPTRPPSPGWSRPWCPAARTARARGAAGRVAFGHRRLSVIDLSTCGAQPMVDNELGLTAVFNGCIYDYQELRAELEGHGYRFFSHSDTEVILKGYHHWGTDVVSHLHGMFAFVDPRAGHRPGGPGPRPARASSRSTSPRRRGGCGSPPRCPALLRGGRRRHLASTRSRCTTT